MEFLTAQKSARIATIGSPDSKNKWLACHGYGELSDYFIKKFEILGDNHFVVAPEGLNRFYLNGFSGRVGASWMTKLNREQDIANNILYLEQVYQQYQIRQHTFYAFGFSQGTETLTRWLAHNNIAPKVMILWGNGLPNDLPAHCAQLWKETIIYVVVGNQDEFLTPTRLEEKLAILDQHQLSYQFISYEGTHKIYPEVLQSIVSA